MSDIRFCPNCGEKRLNEAAFCISCGTRLTGASIPLMVPAVMVVAAVLTFVFIQFVVLKDTAPTTPAQHEHDHAQAESNAPDHHHDYPPEVQALVAKVESGDLNAMIDLTEQQMVLSGSEGDMLFHAGQTIEKFLSQAPTHGYALRLAGNVFYNLNMPDKAVLYYNLYLKQYPADANARTDYGTQLLALGQTDEAIQAYKDAIAAYPDFYNPHFNLNIAYSRKGNEEQAALYLEKANEIDRRVGKKLAPMVNPPRYFEGQANTGSAHPPMKGKTPAVSGTFAALETFFRDHQIIGPKMTDFKVAGQKAALLVRQFPMQGMPPMVKDSLKKKIAARLSDIGPDATCDIVDADTQTVMASYSADKQSGAAAPKTGKFAAMETFFRDHQIIGPKMTGFRAKDNHADLLVRQFPMQGMPPMVKQSLAKKINARLTEIGPQATLNIVDADNNKVMAKYPAAD